MLTQARSSVYKFTLFFLKLLNNSNADFVTHTPFGLIFVAMYALNSTVGV